jgi:hypothetical protein
MPHIRELHRHLAHASDHDTHRDGRHADRPDDETLDAAVIGKPETRPGLDVASIGTDDTARSQE